MHEDEKLFSFCCVKTFFIFPCSCFNEENSFCKDETNMRILNKKYCRLKSLLDEQNDVLASSLSRHVMDKLLQLLQQAFVIFQEIEK